MPAAQRHAAKDRIARVLAPAPPQRIVHDRPPPEEGMMGVLVRMAEAVDTPPMKLMRDFAGLSFGPGRVSFSDYTRLRLYDEQFWAGCDRRTVIGARRNRDLMVQANYRHEWYGLAANKAAANAYLAAYGFPVIPTTALFALDIASPSPKLLRTRDELRQFLADPGVYPLFGKPVEGVQSLGSTAFAGFNAERGVLRAPGGVETPLDHFLEDVCERYPTGYLFQPLLPPHPNVAAMTGGGLATVRMITLATEQGPKVVRACWKIPGAGAFADNYWRRGNLLAQLDLKTGQVLRVTCGAGLELVEVTRHPGTRAPLIGAKVPGWQALKATAVEAARAMHGLGVIGWDMAPAEPGPVIVEMNETPDLFLNQIADRRGALDADFTAFLSSQRQAAAEHMERVKSDVGRL
ncbi:MAG: sugar-transfer associated ATP-grasp domain-containing protein [Caulobacterales bacterium]